MEYTFEKIEVISDPVILSPEDFVEVEPEQTVKELSRHQSVIPEIDLREQKDTKEPQKHNAVIPNIKIW